MKSLLYKKVIFNLFVIHTYVIIYVTNMGKRIQIVGYI